MSEDRAPTHVNLVEKLGAFSEHWAPKIVARYNDNEVRLVKTSGEWIWHKHDETDELFLILDGELFRGAAGTAGEIGHCPELDKADRRAPIPFETFGKSEFDPCGQWHC